MAVNSKNYNLDFVVFIYSVDTAHLAMSRTLPAFTCALSFGSEINGT